MRRQSDSARPPRASTAEPEREPGSEWPLAVAFRHAAVRLGGRTIWSDVTFDVVPGEFVAVLGPNGVGKSTLVKAALGILRLDEGHATVLGRPPGRANREIGYLPQRRSFDAGLRVRGSDIVRLGLDGDRWGVPLGGQRRGRGRAQRRRVEQLIEFVGAQSYADRPVGQVSGGEQQRLLIAQALVRDPALLLLDEPLDSLDLPNQSSVAALISQVSRAHQVTVMIVAHDVNPLLPYVDRVIYLAQGGAVAGTTAEVITGPTLSALYGTPIEVLQASDGRLVVVGQPEAPSLHSDRHGG